MKWCIIQKEQSVTLPSGQSPIEKSDPNPPQQEEESHEWERKGKPGAKIDEVTFWKVTTARRSPKGQRCHNSVNIQKKQQATSLADQSGWGWALCPWAWPSLLYWLHRGCISRILSTPSGDTEPLLGSPQMWPPHAGASHRSLSAAPCRPSCTERHFVLDAQWIANMYQ